MGIIMTAGEMERACAYWQDKLGLSHWEVGIRIARAGDMPLPGSAGCNEFDISSEQALISILDPVDYASAFPQDMEKALVHELIHIPMRYISEPARGTLEWAHMEAAIDRLAGALVFLRREAAQDPPGKNSGKQ